MIFRSLGDEKYLETNIEVPVYRQERSQCTQNTLRGHDAWDEQNFPVTFYNSHYHYGDQADQETLGHSVFVDDFRSAAGSVFLAQFMPQLRIVFHDAVPDGFIVQ